MTDDLKTRLRERTDTVVVPLGAGSTQTLHLPHPGDSDTLCTQPGNYGRKDVSVYPAGYATWCQRCIEALARVEARGGYVRD